MKNLLEVLSFKDGCRVYFFNKDRLHHFSVMPGEALTFNCENFITPTIIKYRDVKVTYYWWERRWAKT